MRGELARQQEWLQAAILWSADTAEAGTVITPSAALSASARLAIYQHGYRSRLLHCMRAHYPVLCHLLGRDLFDAFTLDYLRANPSHSRSLDSFGARFADHLQATRPDPGPDWSDLMVDIARLERAFAEVNTGPGIEGEERAVVPRSGWLDAVVLPAPCLRLLTLDFPAHHYLTAVRRGDHSYPLLRRARTHLVLFRDEYLVTATELDPSRWRLLAALVAGNDPRTAARLTGTNGEDAVDYLREWAARRFVAIDLPGPVGAGADLENWKEPRP